LYAVSISVRSEASMASKSARNKASSYAAQAIPEATLMQTSHGSAGDTSHSAGSGTMPARPRPCSTRVPRRRAMRPKSGRLTIFARHEAASSNTYCA
jgi:hypothetical protein